MKTDDRRVLDTAFEELERETPRWLTRTLEWLRRPAVRWVRIPLGLLFIASSVFWFMPIVGLEYLPIGLLLLAIDVPFLRRPVARAVLWLVHGYRRLRARWRKAMS